MDNLKVGIIGLGGIARSHCDAIETLDNVEIVAVADLIEENRREYMGKYDIPKSYPSHTDLLKDPEIDAVAITLGHQLHQRLTVGVEVVGVDEAQFFDQGLVQLAMDMADLGVRMIIAGLDQDFSRQPFGPMPDDPLWWVRSLLERETLPHRRQAVVDRIDAAIAEAIRHPSLDEARALLGSANAVAVRWNDEHDERDHVQTRSEIWLITERARRPA